jgi:hypothetical protein
MRWLSVLLLLFAAVFASPIPGVCDQNTNQCLSSLAQLTSFKQCGMPPDDIVAAVDTATTRLDPQSLEWGICACPKLVPIFECLKRAEKSCPLANQAIRVYGDQVEKGCRLVDLAENQQTVRKFRFFK